MRTEFLSRIELIYANARPHYRSQAIAALATLFDRFLDEKLHDPAFAKLLARGSESEHQQRLAELLLADHLWSAGFSLASKAAGPDFLATRHGEATWIELITPMPSGIDASWRRGGAGVWDYPHKEIALRYTAALKEKREKLMGTATKQGYLAKSLVGANERYVIAINQSMLQPIFQTLSGISQIPTACEVAFAVGPRQLTLERATGAVISSEHAHRAHLQSASGSAVPAGTFLSRDYEHVSGTLALSLTTDKFIDLDPDTFLLRDHLSALVYNPLAVNVLPRHWLPAQSHWSATISTDSVEVARL